MSIGQSEVWAKLESELNTANINDRCQTHTDNETTVRACFKHSGNDLDPSAMGHQCGSAATYIQRDM